MQLLDACVSNCGKMFHLEIASRDFESDLRKLVNHSQPKIAEKMKGLLKKWAEGDFKSDPQLNLIPSLYNKLRNEGHKFTSVSDMVSFSISKFIYKSCIYCITYISKHTTRLLIKLSLPRLCYFLLMFYYVFSVFVHCI